MTAESRLPTSVFERYLLPGIPLMLICARPGTKPDLALIWAGRFQLPLALARLEIGEAPRISRNLSADYLV